MRELLYRLAIIVLCGSVFIGCSHKEGSQDKPDTITIDFGEGTYRPNPFKFLDNVIPFSWLGMPDSVKKDAEIVVAFNEDAVRSNSQGNIFLVDSKGNRINGVKIGASQKGELPIKAGKQEAIIPISFIVNPEVGDSLLTGSIMVVGDKLDEVNNTQLTSSATPVASWQLNHQTGINWWRWLLLLLVVALILTIICLVFYCIWEVGKIVVTNMPSIPRGKPHRNKTKKKKKKKECPCEEIKKIILGWERELYSNITIADKYDILEKMRLKFDELYSSLPECYAECKKAVKNNTWEALEFAWNYWQQFPKNNVIWPVENKICILTPDHKNYEICRKRGFLTCRYDIHGSPNFDIVTIPGSIVPISDLYDSLSSMNIKSRGRGKNSLQVIAQERMMNNLMPVIRKWAEAQGCEADFWKWRDAHDLVPHEDTNCRTMRLVFRPAHEAFKHRGGVANAINIKNHFGS